MDHAEEINPPAPAASCNADAKRILNGRGLGAGRRFRAQQEGDEFRKRFVRSGRAARFYRVEQGRDNTCPAKVEQGVTWHSLVN